MMQNKMHVIGITGGIGAGKSCVTSYLYKRGIDVVDADVISHELTQKDAPGTLVIAQCFGAQYAPNGELDRRALAQLVFSDAKKRQLLDAILHPMVIGEMKARLEVLQKQNKTLAVLDVPLLFESGADALADEIWCVDAPIDMRIERIVARDKVDVAHARARIASQMSDDLRKQKSDVILDNTGVLVTLYAKIDALLQERGFLI